MPRRLQLLRLTGMRTGRTWPRLRCTRQPLEWARHGPTLQDTLLPRWKPNRRAASCLTLRTHWPPCSSSSSSSSPPPRRVSRAGMCRTALSFRGRRSGRRFWAHCKAHCQRLRCWRPEQSNVEVGWESRALCERARGEWGRGEGPGQWGALDCRWLRARDCTWALILAELLVLVGWNAWVCVMYVADCLWSLVRMHLRRGPTSCGVHVGDGYVRRMCASYTVTRTGPWVM